MPEEYSSPGDMFTDLAQVGVVVKDLDRAVKFLSEVFGLGPFQTMTIPLEDGLERTYTYHGQPAEFTYRLALGTVGPVELEIVQPLAGENIYSDFLEEHGEGIHHIRFNVRDVEPVIEYLTKHGLENIGSGTGLRPGTTWVNFSTEIMCGFVIEVMNVLAGTNGRAPQVVDGKVQL